MSKLLIFTGLPYSGKSTLRVELVERFNFDYVSIDEIMLKKKMWENRRPTQEDWNTAYKEAYKLIKKLLEQGKTVVYDTAHLPKRERDDIIKYADDLGFKYKLIYIKVSRDEIYRRCEENLIHKKRGHLSDDLMETVFRMWEEPSPDEDYLVYDSKENLDAWIQKNKQVLTS